MKRVALALATFLVTVLVTALVGTAPSAGAGQDDGIDWGISNWTAGVQMTTSFPSAADPHVHLRFKRVGGEGQRQVRMGERHKTAGTHQWGPYRYTKAVKLQVGDKVVFTTKAALPCQPAKEPLGIVADVRVKMPGKAWSSWETWISEDHRLLDCEE